MSALRKSEIDNRKSQVIAGPWSVDNSGSGGRPPVRKVAAIRSRVVPQEALARLRPLVEAASRAGGPVEPGGWEEALAVTLLLYCAPIRATAFGLLSWDNVAEDADGWAFVSTLDKGRREVEAEIAPEQWSLIRPLLVRLSGYDPRTASGYAVRRAGVETGERSRETAAQSVPLFGAVLDRHQVRRRVRRVTRELTGRRYSAHWMRHTHGCHAAAAGAPSLAIAQQLGHSSTDTTERYYVRIARRGGSSRYLSV